MDEDPARASITVAAYLCEPFHHYPGFARPAFGVEYEDAHDAIVPGLIESRQLRLSACEALSVGAQYLQTVRQGGGGGRWRHGRFGTVRYGVGNALHYDAISASKEPSDVAWGRQPSLLHTSCSFSPVGAQA